MQPFLSARPRRWMVPLGAGLIFLGALGTLIYWKSASARTPLLSRSLSKPSVTPTAHAGKDTPHEEVQAEVELSRSQQEAIGLAVAPVTLGAATEVVEAPGQIIPDESKFAYITPRAAGVVRAVAAHVGQNVRAGDLLAMIDSSQISQARFDLYSRLQELEIDKTQAEWQETIYQNTMAMVERLKAGDSPEQLHRRFEDRPVGANREQILTAYANFRLSSVTMDRNRELIAQGVITPKQFQQVRADFESAQATYQGLMDEMEFNTRLANVRAQQALKRAETAVRVAREQLRVLGVRPDGTEPQIKDGHVVGVRSDGILPPGAGHKEPVATKPEEILPETKKGEAVPVAPVGSAPDTDQGTKAQDLPVSAYAIWAPFDGTILDRELIVPGVFVDTTHRIFTLADLSTVWVEVNIHEGHYGALARSQDAELTIASPAYPGRTFKVEVIYTGDLVDPKSRTIKLLARADNSDRMLKPGMFVDVTMRLKGLRQAPLVPEEAVLNDDDGQVVYVQTGPERFERRQVVTGTSDGDKTAIITGLQTGEKVVVKGGFKLKSKATQHSDAVTEPEPE
jgi:membrane fusion protein, heavy metal efflux system